MKSLQLALREMQLKTTLRYGFLTIRLAKIQMFVNTLGENVENHVLSHPAHRGAKWYNHWSRPNSGPQRYWILISGTYKYYLYGKGSLQMWLSWWV